MQIGMVGLGRMGANIARRLMRAGHACVVYDRDPEPGPAARGRGRGRRRQLGELVQALARAARASGSCCRPARRRKRPSPSSRRCSPPGDTIIDGGNTFWKDDVRRARELKAKGLHYLDVGTSGGVWGLERGYCLMIGGDKAAVERLDPDLRRAGAGQGRHPADRRPHGARPRAEQGYLHAGPSGAGHFVKMIHNGIEYGMMQAIAEGFDILKNAGSAAAAGRSCASTIDVADVAEVWRRGSVITSWLLDLTAAALAEDARACGLLRPRRGFRRGPLDRAGGDRGGGAGRGADRRALRALPLAPGPHLRREGALRHAQGLRRPRRAEELRPGCSSARMQDARTGPLVIVLMGVSAAARARSARRLSQALGWPFRDADSFHPPANIEKMSRGVPLDRRGPLAVARCHRAWIDERRGAGSTRPSSPAPP